MKKITFLAYDQCMLSGISDLIDAFSISNFWYEKNVGAKDSLPLFETEIVSSKGQKIITNSGIEISPDHSMKDVKNTDLILIPPFLCGTWPLPEEISEILEWLKEQYASNVRIGGMCTGTYILAMTGLLDGKIATTNWQIINRFKRVFPKVFLKPERIVTEDDGLLCSGALTAHYNLALYVIELFGSEEVSRACAKVLLVDPSRDTQAPYMMTKFRKNHGDQEILKAQLWMEENYANNISVEATAKYVNLSTRHFKRRFKKATNENPLAYLQQVRLESGKKQLETTNNSIDEITQKIGYEDSSSFRRLFKRYTSLSPREYRDKFSICKKD